MTDINSELDELDREEFYRLKKVSYANGIVEKLFISFLQVKNNKQRDNANAEAEEKKDRRGSDKENDEASGLADVLGEQEDQDVIF